METILYVFLFLLFALFVILILGAWIRSHWAEIRNAIQAPYTVRNTTFSKKSKEQELLPPQFQDVSADLAPLVLAIYNSVKRYKNLFLTNLNKHYYFTARSIRYELRISLSPVSFQKYFLNAVLEGEHPHELTIDQSGVLSLNEGKREKKQKITEAEIMPFLEPLSFFNKVEARPGILRASQTLGVDTVMESWPQVLSAFIRLGRFLMDTEVRQLILEAADVLCPYCRGEFCIKDDTVSCRVCKTRHHKECWEEVDRCSVFGCGSKSEIVISQN